MLKNSLFFALLLKTTGRISMRKKIFILINTLGTGGAERVVSLLIHAWKNRYDITLVVLSNIIEYDLPENISVVCLNQPFKENGFITTLKLPLLARKYKKLCDKNRPDISFSALKRTNYINCFSKMFGSKAKIILCDGIHFSEFLKTVPLLERKVSIFLTRKLYKYADEIIPNSTLMKVDLEKNFNIHSKYVVIHNPMNMAFINRLSQEEIDFPYNDSFNFINVGVFRKQKNHENLIDAFDKIKHLNVRLFLLGHRYLKEEVIMKVKNMQLESRVIFLEFDTNPFKYLSRCDCFVLSSDFEGFPNALQEAMACGLPVISTDCLSGPREILAPGTDPSVTVKDQIEIAEYGILVPVKNSQLLAGAMELIVTDKELCEHLKRKAKERSMDFESGKIIDQYTKAVESV